MNFATLILGADTRQLKPAVTELKALTAEGAKADTQSKKTGAAMQGMAVQAGVAETATRKLRDAKGRYIPAAQQAAAAAAAAAKGMHSQMLAARAAAFASDQASKATAMLYSRLMLIGGAALGFSAVTQTIAGFETAMSGVAAVTRATDRELALLRDTAKDLGATTEFSAKQAADGLRFLGMAGFSAADAVSAIPDVLNLATAAQMDLASAADISSNIMSGFGIAADQAGKVADVLAAASSRSNTSVSQLGQAMSTVAPISKALGISLEDTAAAIGTLSDAGIQGERAGTALRGSLAALAGPTTQSEAILKKLGLTAKDINPELHNLETIFRTLKDANMSTADAMAIFGREAASAALVLTNSSTRVGEFGDELTRVEGEAQRMADTMRDNLGGDLAGLGSAIAGLVIQLGEAGLTGALRGSIQAATELTRWISANLVPAFQVVAIAVGSLALTQLPAAIAAFYSFAAAGGVATLGLGVFTTAVNVARAATIALGGPLGIVWGLIGAAGASWLVFRDNTSEADRAMMNARSAADAVNAALGTFFATAAPSAGKAAVELANDFYKLADAAVAAAESELARKIAFQEAADAAGQKGMGYGRAAQNMAARQRAEAEEDLRLAREALSQAHAARERTARAVSSSVTSQRMTDNEAALNLDINLNLPDMPDPETPSGSGKGGRSRAGGAGAKTEAVKQAEAAAEALSKLRQEHQDLAATVAMTAEEERVYQAIQELGTGATAAQIEEVRKLIPEMDALKAAKERVQAVSANGKSTMEDFFGSIVSGAKSGREAVIALLEQIAKVQMMNGVMKAFGMAGGGGFSNFIGNLITPSFDGGGYTGSRPRSGGLDGKGGFLSMLHPQETVVDHSKGQGMAANMNININGAMGNSEIYSMVKEGIGAALDKYDASFDNRVNHAIKFARG